MSRWRSRPFVKIEATTGTAVAGTPPARLRAYPHLADRLFGTPIAIEPRKLGAILSALGPRLGLDTAGLDALPSPAAAETRDPLSVVNGVAVIDVFGSLVHRGSFMDAMSGLSSYDDLAGDLAAALADSSVDSILLRIDSGGGECSGVFDFADAVFAARSVKPVVAIAEDMACSAAYLIGSAATSFYATQSATVGSIGVVMAHVDTTRADAMEGVTVTQFHAGARKIDTSPHKSLDAGAIAALQGHVDSFYGLFVSAVARNRGISAAAIESTEAGVFIGSEAVTLGLVDGISTFASLLGDMKADPSTKRTTAMPMRLMRAKSGRIRVTAQAGIDDYDSFDDCVADNQDSDDPEGFCALIPRADDTGDDDAGADTDDDSAGAAARATPPTSSKPKKEQLMTDAEIKAMKAKLEALEGDNAKLTTANAKSEAELAAKSASLAAAEDVRKSEVIDKHMKRGAVVPSMLAAIKTLAGAYATAPELDAALASYPVILHKAAIGAADKTDGSPAAGTDADSPFAKLTAIAKAKTVANPKRTHADAFLEACSENPTLYREHRTKHIAANRT